MDIDTIKFTASSMQTSSLLQSNGFQKISDFNAGIDSYDDEKITSDDKAAIKTDLKTDDQIKSLSSKNTSEEKRAAEKQRRINEEMVKKAIDSANKIFLPSNRKLEYRIHEKSQKIIVKVIDTNTDEVIREIPPEKVLDSYFSMLELAGLLIDTHS